MEALCQNDSNPLISEKPRLHSASNAIDNATMDGLSEPKRHIIVDRVTKTCVRENSVKSILRSKTREESSDIQRSRSKSRSSVTQSKESSEKDAKSETVDIAKFENRDASRDRKRSKSREQKKFDVACEQAVKDSENDTTIETSPNDAQQKLRGRSKSQNRSKSRERSKSSVRSSTGTKDDDGSTSGTSKTQKIERTTKDLKNDTAVSTARTDELRKPRGRSKSQSRSKSVERSKSSARSSGESEDDEKSTSEKSKQQKTETTKSRSKSRGKSRSKSRDSRKESSDGKKHVIRIKLGSKDASLEKLMSSRTDSFRDTEKDILERLLVEHRLLMEEQQTLAMATDVLTKSNIELADDLRKIRNDTMKVRLANQRIQQETHQLEDSILPAYRDNVSNLESTLEQQSCTSSFENSLRSLYQEAVRKMCKKVRKRPSEVELSEKMKVLAATEMAAADDEDEEDEAESCETEEKFAAHLFPFDNCEVHLWDDSDATGLTLDESGVYVDDNSESGVFNDNDSDEDDHSSTFSKRIG